MMILQIRSMLSVLVQCADARRDRSEISAACAFLRQAFCILGAEHVTRRSDATGQGCRCHLKAVGDAARPVDEQRGCLRRADLARGLFEQIEPAVEMIPDQVQWNMRPQRSK